MSRDELVQRIETGSPICIAVWFKTPDGDIDVMYVNLDKKNFLENLGQNPDAVTFNCDIVGEIKLEVEKSLGWTVFFEEGFKHEYEA